MTVAANFSFNPLLVFKIGLISALVLGSGFLLASGAIPLAFACVALLFFFRLYLIGPWPVLMIWFIGMPTCFVFANNLLQGVAFLKAERIIFIIATSFFLLEAIFKRSLAVKTDSVERAFAFLLSLFAISMFSLFAEKDLDAFFKQCISFFLDGYLMPFMAYVYVRRCRWSTQKANIFLYLMLFTGIYHTLTAVLQIFAGVVIFVPEYTEVLHADTGRATGVFTGAAEFGPVAATCFMVAAGMAANARTRMVAMLLSLSMLVIMVAVILCETRAAWVGLIVALGFIYYQDPRSRPFLNFFLFLGVFAGIIVMPLVLDLDKLEHRVLDLVPVYNRLAGWGTAVNMALHNPLGVGFSRYGFGQAKEAYFISIGDISSLWAAELGVPHNEFIHLLALTGFPGLGLFIFCIITLYKRLQNIWKDTSLTMECRTIGLYVNAIVVGNWVFNGMFVDIGPFLYLYTQFFCLAGFAVMVSEMPESKLVPDQKKLSILVAE